MKQKETATIPIRVYKSTQMKLKKEKERTGKPIARIVSDLMASLLK